MIDLRALSYLLVACEHENLGIASQELGIAPSTLSASLKSLEQSFGVSLFRKQGSGLSPRRLTHWLYRAAIPLLLVEGFTRRRLAGPPAADTAHLQIDVRLRFVFGRINRALNHAIQAAAREEPLLLCEPVWRLESGAEFGTAPIDTLGFASSSTLTIEPGEPGADDIVLVQDPWVVVRRQLAPDRPQAAEDRQRPLLLPPLPIALAEQITAHLRRHGHAAPVALDPAHDDWPQLVDQDPGAAVLLPASALASRLGTIRASVEPLDPPLASAIVARHGGDPIARRLAERIRHSFAAATRAEAFVPVLTGRRIRYFNLAHDLGRVSAAARAASVAQPALSQQLQKLEASVGVRLFDRHSFGLVPTPEGERFAVASKLLDRRLRELEASGKSASLAEGGRLSLGVLPSVSHHGHLVSRITDAVLAMRDRYPQMSLSVQEAPNSTLQNWVTRGRVSLAIVETALPQLPRLPLDAVEELCVIADPRHGLLKPGPVALRDLAKLTLALPTKLFGLRQLVDATARAAHLELRPKHEVDALTMLIAMLSREAIATILPASAVWPELASGELAAHPIVEPTIMRKLFVIYSGDRSLTPAERSLVQLLRGKLAEPLVSAPFRMAS